jgi:hypothetical protein
MLLLFSPDVIGQIDDGCEGELDSVASRKIVGLRVLVYRVEETAKALRCGGAPVIRRTAKIVAETVVCLSLFSNQ